MNPTSYFFPQKHIDPRFDLFVEVDASCIPDGALPPGSKQQYGLACAGSTSLCGYAVALMGDLLVVLNCSDEMRSLKATLKNLRRLCGARTCCHLQTSNCLEMTRSGNRNVRFTCSKIPRVGSFKVPLS